MSRTISKTDEIFVANDMASSTYSCSVLLRGWRCCSLRVLKGPKSLIKNPTGLFYDAENDELWVANFGNHTATVYKPDLVG